MHNSKRKAHHESRPPTTTTTTITMSHSGIKSAKLPPSCIVLNLTSTPCTQQQLQQPRPPIMTTRRKPPVASFASRFVGGIAQWCVLLETKTNIECHWLFWGGNVGRKDYRETLVHGCYQPHCSGGRRGKSGWDSSSQIVHGTTVGLHWLSVSFQKSKASFQWAIQLYFEMGFTSCSATEHYTIAHSIYELLSAAGNLVQ